jgi:hypothetical protein
MSLSRFPIGWAVLGRQLRQLVLVLERKTMAKLKWEQANQKDRDSLHLGQERRQAAIDGRQLIMEAFVAEHKLRCFRCDRNDRPWAKTGTSWRGPWAICVPCVRSRRRSDG